MRQILVEVSRGEGNKVLEVAAGCNAVNSAQFDASNQSGPLDAVILHVSNHDVGTLIEELDAKVNEPHITLLPTGVLTLRPPASEIASQVTNVEKLSGIEVYLASLQSVGSWKTFLGYSVIAGLVAWIGLYTNSTILVISAMLLAPFASPAMNTAIASARGNIGLLRKSLMRYVVSVSLGIVVAAAMSFLMNQRLATDFMVTASEVTNIAFLLPLIAGAAGALTLSLSDRSSLVTSTATGLVVAAAITPSAAMIGMAATIGRWDMALNGLFILLLQLLGINLMGALFFRFYTGLSTEGPRHHQGRKWLFPLVITVNLLLVGAMLTWQFSSPPNLQRASRAQQATAEVNEVLDDSGMATLVESNLRFTRPSIEGQNTLLGTLYVEKSPNSLLSAEEIRMRLTQEIQTQLQRKFNVVPLIDVIVLEPPPTAR